MRLPLHRGVALFAMMVLSLPAGATTLTCRGELAFADALARAVTVSVELESGLVRIPACTKYPELAGFCQAHILTAKAHRFVFDDVVSLQNSKIRLALHPTSSVVTSTDAVLVAHPKALFLGRCEPARAPSRHRRRA